MVTCRSRERLDRAAVALAGLSVGDAFGERFFVEQNLAERLVADRVIPEAPWLYTDDTEMVLSVVAILSQYGHIEQEALAEPFALWCATQHLADYEEALWLTVSGLGDRDTTCAIVGGIVACYVGEEGIPAAWLQAREPLPDWKR